MDKLPEKSLSPVQNERFKKSSFTKMRDSIDSSINNSCNSLSIEKIKKIDQNNGNAQSQTIQMGDFKKILGHDEKK